MVSADTILLSSLHQSAIALLHGTLRCRGYSVLKVFYNREQSMLQVEACARNGGARAFGVVYLQAHGPVCTPVQIDKEVCPWTPSYRGSNIGNFGYDLTRSLCTFCSAQGYDDIVLVLQSISTSSTRHLRWLKAFTVILENDIQPLHCLIGSLQSSYTVERVQRHTMPAPSLSSEDPLAKVFGLRPGEYVRLVWTEGYTRSSEVLTVQ